jgi:hypothetical protein
MTQDLTPKSERLNQVLYAIIYCEYIIFMQ